MKLLQMIVVGVVLTVLGAGMAKTAAQGAILARRVDSLLVQELDNQLPPVEIEFDD